MLKKVSVLRYRSLCNKVLRPWYYIHYCGNNKQNYATCNPSSTIWLQVLQSGQQDSSPGLYLFTDSSRYLINTGENTLRHLRDSGLPTKGLNRILLTGSSINHIGGLINMLLATQDRNNHKSSIYVYGPSNVEAFLQTIRKSFQYLSKFEFVKLQLIDEKVSWQEILNDENCRIFACAFSTAEKNKDDSMIYPRLAISYIFELHKPSQRVSLQGMKELGVDDDIFENVVKECKKGNSFNLPSGRVVTPNDILEAPQNKQSFIVVDCPSRNVFKMLTQTDFINEVDTHIDLMIHMTPYDIVTTDEYKSWMRKFNYQTKHLLMSHKVDSNPSPTVFTFDEIYEKLSNNHLQVFPALNYSVLDINVMDFMNCTHKIKSASPSLKYIFRPQRIEGFKNSPVVSKIESLIKPVRNDKHKKTLNLDKNNDFEVVFLGTGSRVSSILRNTSGILLNLSDKSSLLMDCGEGTYRQMCYHYGQDINIILKQLRTIFVSHMHIDHHLGLINILLQRKKVVPDCDYVRIIGPESLDLYLRYFEMLSGESLNFRFTQFWWLKRGLGNIEGRIFSRSLGLSSISVVPTKHSDYSHALVVERNSWKIVYSADTRPCKQLIDAGKRATLLIHEATFQDELMDRAKATNHCTVSEAIRCSKLMKAEHTILTHISSRHLFPCQSSRLPDRVSFAFDHMTVQQKYLNMLPRIMPNLEKIILHSQQRKPSRRKHRF